MGIAQRAGRAFSAADRADSVPVAVIDEELARRLFGQEDPVGRRIQLSMNRAVWREVVGVVGAVHQTSLDRPAEPHAYLPETQLASTALTIVARSGGDPASVAAVLRRAVADIDPELALSNVRTLADLAAGSTRPQRQNTLLLGVFATAAVLLTLIGVYGVIAQIVAQSARELGVRLALGANGRSIVALTVRRALVMALIGVAAGSLVAAVAAPALRSMLYGIGPRDPLTFALVIAILLASAAVAAYVPARRILRLDVLATLRVE
jgi:putative ABC transport system permease protein